MADKLTKGPAKPEGAKPRSTGDHLRPEGAEPRFTPPQRGKYPKGTVPKPGQRVKPGKSGDSQSNSQPSNKVPPIATREGGGEGKPAGSRKSPWKANSGSKSRI